MNTRLLALFVLGVGLGVLPTLTQAIALPGPAQSISLAGLSAAPAPRHTTADNGGPESFFDIFVQVPELDVEIVSLSLTGIELGVGQTTTLTAQTCPPISDTGGVLQWTVLSGMGTISGLGTGETITLKLEHPGPISHDTPGVVVGVEYTVGSRTVSDTLSIRLNEVEFTQPYIRDYTLHWGGKPFPEPGDVVSITLEHALPPGYVPIHEMIDPMEIYTDAETFVPVRLQAAAEYLAPDGITHVFDVHSEEFALPFSYDKDANGVPDLVDAQYTAALGSLYSLPLDPPINDPWRGPEALVAHMVFQPVLPFPTLTFSPNCKLFGYYQWTPSCSVNDLQLCPKAFITPLQLKVTLCHEMKHWWDAKITGQDQGEKNVERFGWPCGWLLCVAQHPLNPEICWTKKDAEIFKRIDPPMDPPTTVQVLWGAHVTGTLMVSNTNAAYALENPQLRLKHIMTSGGQYATGDTLGGGVSVGANGLANTAAVGDDVQLIPVGQGAPYQIVIEPGPNGQLDTLPLGDDTLFSSEDRLTSGANGIVETTAQGDDVQVIAVGQGFTAPTFMPLAVGAGPDGVLNSTPGGDDQAVPPPTLPVTNIQVTTPVSIPAGGQGDIVVTFDMADHIPGQASGAGVVQMVFELEAQQGGGTRRQTIEMYLFLPPKLYLPMVLRSYAP